MNKLECPENQFNEKIAVTLHELSGFLNVSVRTIQRMAGRWGTIRSYDHNGRYLSLEKLAKFNSHGIWDFNGIHFSKFGDLKSTLVAIVNNSSQGMDAPQVRDVLGVDTRSFLYQYKDVSGIKRERMGGNYVYFSSNSERFLEQSSRRKQNLAALTQPLLKDTTAIGVLVETIKHPLLTVEELSEHLHKLGMMVKPAAIQAFFDCYGIEKKTGLR